MVISLDQQPGVSGFMNLTHHQRDTIQTAERVGATLSLAGVSFVTITFLLYKRMRTVTNTFIFFASIANIGASIACLIGYDGIIAGDYSALCQTQAFLLEMFMQSDPMWSFAMAINVYLIFFTRYDPDTAIRKMWLFCLMSFGLPAIPAFICLFYQPHGRPIYGNATLWCWISDQYNSLRIFTYYIPIWLCTFGSTIIYLSLGYHVFLCRDELRNLTMSSQVHEFSSSEVRDSADKSLVGQTGSYGTVTTEVQVTTANCPDIVAQTRPPTPAPSIPPVLPSAQPGNSQLTAPWTSCSDEITAVSASSPTPGCTPTASATTEATPTTPYTVITSSHTTKNGNRHRSRHVRTNAKKRPFLKSMLRTTFAITRKLRKMYANIDPIKRAYLRTSFIFAVSVLVTWTPSSINRVYTLINPTSTNYALNLASAIVLPLQGVWNVLIYVITSWDGLAEEFCKLFGLPSPREEWLRKQQRRKYEAWGVGADTQVGGTTGGGAMDLERGMGWDGITEDADGLGSRRSNRRDGVIGGTGGGSGGGGQGYSERHVRVWDGRPPSDDDDEDDRGRRVGNGRNGSRDEDEEEIIRHSIGGGEMPRVVSRVGDASGGRTRRNNSPKRPMRILAKGYL